MDGRRNDVKVNVVVSQHKVWWNKKKKKGKNKIK